MGWNALLKPTAAKLVLFVLLFVALVPFLEYDNGIRCIRAPCPASSQGSILMYLAQDFQMPGSTPIYQLRYEILIPGLLLSYLAACLLAYLYGKITSKKK